VLEFGGEAREHVDVVRRQVVSDDLMAVERAVLVLGGAKRIERIDRRRRLLLFRLERRRLADAWMHEERVRGCC